MTKYSPFYRVWQRVSKQWIVGASVSTLLLFNALYSVNLHLKVSESHDLLPRNSKGAELLASAYGLASKEQSGTRNIVAANWSNIKLGDIMVEKAIGIGANSQEKVAVNVSQQDITASVSTVNGFKISSVRLEHGATLYSSLVNSGFKPKQSYLIAKAVSRVFPIHQLRTGEEVRVMVPVQQKGNDGLALSFSNNKGSLVLVKISDNKCSAERLRGIMVGDLKVLGTKLRSWVNGGNAPTKVTPRSDEALVNPPVLQKSQRYVSSKTAKYLREGSIFSKAKVSEIAQQSPGYYLAAGNIDWNSGDIRKSLQRIGIAPTLVGEVGQFVKLVAKAKKMSGSLHISCLYSKAGPGHVSIRSRDGQGVSAYYFAGNGAGEFLLADGSHVIGGKVLQAPLKKIEISSGYGMRKSPFSNRRQMHSGIDFRAPKGTPVFSAADGVVKAVDRHRQYGRLVKVQHGSDYSTLYAHLDGFAKDLRPGTKVAKGQLIGYVGSTGRSTGYHLHFEAHHRGVRINPQPLLGSGRKLSGRVLTAFNKQKGAIDSVLSRHAYATVDRATKKG